MKQTLSLGRLKLSAINKKVLILIGLSLLAVAGELGLRAWEAQQKLEGELKSLRSRIHVLQASAEQMDWAALSQDLDRMQQDLQAQLWQAPSEAQAQAMLRDWLSSTLKTAGIQRPTLRLQPPQSAASPAAAAPGSARPDDAQPPAAASTTGVAERLVQQAIRVRAQISFELAPGMLEAVLQQVERSGQLASVDSLSVSKRNRRIEMTVSMPVIIKPAPASEEKRG